MTVRVTHQINQAAVAAFGAPGGRVYQDTLRRGILVQNGARVRCPVDTGRLRSSINVEGPVIVNGVAGVRVGTIVEYAIFVHEGTRYMVGRPFLRDALADARY